MTSGQIRSVTPILLVVDVVKAAAYYAGALGFRAPRMWGEPPDFCILRRDGAELMLNQVGPGQPVHTNAQQDGRFDAYLHVGDADSLYEEFKANGADIVCEPEDHEYEMREFQVRDLDGHLLAFGQDISGIGSA